MVLAPEIMSFASVQTLLFGIPESIGLLAFGVGLTTAAVIVRRVLSRSEAKRENEGDSKASTR
jgi:hypothetical protein